MGSRTLLDPSTKEASRRSQRVGVASEQSAGTESRGTYVRGSGESHILLDEPLALGSFRPRTRRTKWPTDELPQGRYSADRTTLTMPNPRSTKVVWPSHRATGLRCSPNIRHFGEQGPCSLAGTRPKEFRKFQAPRMQYVSCS